jgi:hypothetical protein
VVVPWSGQNLREVGVDFQARTRWEAIDEAPDFCLPYDIFLFLLDAGD